MRCAPATASESGPASVYNDGKACLSSISMNRLLMRGEAVNKFMSSGQNSTALTSPMKSDTRRMGLPCRKRFLPLSFTYTRSCSLRPRRYRERSIQKRRFLFLNQIPILCRAMRSHRGTEIQCLQKIRLPLCIAPADQLDPIIEMYAFHHGNYENEPASSV